jgi:hypothetical protein
MKIRLAGMVLAMHSAIILLIYHKTYDGVKAMISISLREREAGPGHSLKGGGESIILNNRLQLIQPRDVGNNVTMSPIGESGIPIDKTISFIYNTEQLTPVCGIGTVPQNPDWGVLLFSFAG